MITTLVQIKMQAQMSLEKAKALFSGTAPQYRDVPGLIRKYYLLSEDGNTAGGVYLWESREAAEAMYSPAWYAFIREKYGKDPVVTYFECPVVVDNLTAEIIEADPVLSTH
jgi:hypothetical protein